MSCEQSPRRSCARRINALAGNNERLIAGILYRLESSAGTGSLSKSLPPVAVSLNNLKRMLFSHFDGVTSSWAAPLAANSVQEAQVQVLLHVSTREGVHGHGQVGRPERLMSIPYVQRARGRGTHWGSGSQADEHEWNEGKEKH